MAISRGMRESGAWLGRITCGSGTRMPGIGHAMNATVGRKGLDYEAIISRMRRESVHDDRTSGGGRDHCAIGSALIAAFGETQGPCSQSQMHQQFEASWLVFPNLCWRQQRQISIRGYKHRCLQQHQQRLDAFSSDVGRSGQCENIDVPQRFPAVELRGE